MQSIRTLVLMLAVGSALFKKPLSLHRYFKMSLSSELVVHVRGSVSAENVPLFYTNTLNNARNSVLEVGVSRFDVLSALEAPGNFLLIEAYKNDQAPAEHKLTAHYNHWRDAVAPLMTVPRSAIKYQPIFPPRIAWKTEVASSDIGSQHFEPVTFSHDSFTQAVHYGTKKFRSLLAVLVDIDVKAGSEDSFIEATILNCRNSLLEVSYNINPFSCR